MFFKFLHSLSGSAEPLIVVIVEQNHASGDKAGVEKYKTGQNGGVQVGIQAYQTKALLFQSCRCIRKYPLRMTACSGKGSRPSTACSLVSENSPSLAMEHPLLFSSFISRGSNP